MSAKLVNTWENGPENWVLQLQVIDDHSWVASHSDGTLNLYDAATLRCPVQTINAHESSINCIKLISNGIASCSTDGIKVWDLRTEKLVHQLHNPKNTGFLSLDFHSNMLAGGTELIGTDAEVHVWDLRNPGTPIKSYVDSHHDDVTCVRFHPQYSQYLMSGSTDGYVNVYDLKEQDEDDALHQVINYSSVHSCQFVSKDRIGILSHMETLSFHQLNNTNYEVWEEPVPKDLGDARQVWGCEYVVDVNPQGYVSYGTNSNQELTLRSFSPLSEQFGMETIVFPGAHGDEVVRDLQVFAGGKQALSCGEDGSVKMWDLPWKVELEVPGVEAIELEAPEKKEKKEKHRKKDKKDKKDKKKKKKDVRYKPY
ncbi:hypothetical protein PSN45_003504 [Yamadazyma tenuis]|uniref:WD40 repeat-like protein n=1 Tax=Candida tenuis (strain ATCC 10573 / BCRC 21748 / CBS 615 / JCM 9827 / NBRC 10315 / NRRL Y-1498 / VKM Y-70) TaxID=590646 RepID=G3AXX0_CANTC|nr:WD40 repeat-like protein [Yamadazyma tenuis ATCC 10573]EGV65714.1 WD40 repeat-like protein [Yamadazyma tenuis ATCC 10573]WEJ95970.1 hypothetical protein PSN45_003504 [Yamadazyma tenuis]